MFFVSLVEQDTQRQLLDYFFQQCTDFSVMYPGGTEENPLDNPLLEQRGNFLKLKNICISIWSGMENGIKLSGSLTNEARHLFYLSLCNKGLWCYRLFIKNDEVFAVNDFDVGILKISEEEVDILIQKKVIKKSFLM